MTDFFDAIAEDTKIKAKDWMPSKRFILGTVENLPAIIDACIASGRYACDLETTGIDNRTYSLPSGIRCTYDTIAGVGLSPDGVTGYYIPIGHVAIDDKTQDRVPRTDVNVPIPVFAKEFLRLVEATNDGRTVAIFHNGKFDHEFLQFNGTGIPWGEWEKPSAWDDTMILCHLRNSRARNKKLKDLAKQPPDMPKEAWAMAQCGGPGLGMEMIELHELFGHKTGQDGFRYDFSILDPSSQETLWYACGDVICTWLLYPVLAPHTLDPDTDGQTQRAIYAIEKGAVTACRWMERSQIHVDLARVDNLITIGHKEWYSAISDVYQEASRILGRNVMPGKYRELAENFVTTDPKLWIPHQLEVAERKAKHEYAEKGITVMGREGRKFPAVYDVSSPQQLGTMFDEMDVPNLKHTEKSGQVKTSKDELERVIEEAGDQFPFMSKIRRFREVTNALSSYLYPMAKDIRPTGDTDPTGGFMRISFNGHKVDTGRYATPAKENALEGGREGWPTINFHSIPRTDYDPKKPRPECMRRIREVITARPVPVGAPPKYIAAIDFSGQELRVVTNLSGEPKWINEFFRCSGCNRTFTRDARGANTRTPPPPPRRCPNCGSDRIGDLHTLTGIEIYGADAPNQANWKVLRTNSKGVNFGLCYGGGGQAVQRATGCDKNEGWRVKRVFDKTYNGLQTWWAGQWRFARKHGYVRTPFGRRYPLPDINHPDGFFKSKAERNAVNGPIQGAGADLMKIGMGILYHAAKKRGWLDKCMIIASMHDELVFEIDGDIIEEALGLLVQIMTENNLILGRNWAVPLTCDVEIGRDWAVPWDTTGMLHGESKFYDGKKVKSKDACPAGVDFDSLPSWPDELKPWFAAARGEVLANTPAASFAPPATSGGGDGGSAADTGTEAGTEPAASAPTPIAPMMAVNVAHFGGGALIPAVPDSNWVFRLDAPLTPDTAVKLAEVIVASRGRGTMPLRVQLASGDMLDLEGQMGQFGVTMPILVNAVQFEATWNARTGLYGRR